MGGALWAGLAAVLRYWRRVPEVITTLLLVFIAAQLTGYALTKHLPAARPARIDRTRRRRARSSAVDPAAQVHVFGNEFPCVGAHRAAPRPVVAVALGRTVWGFRCGMVGENPRTAQRAGVGAVAAGSAALLLGGGLAGLAGAPDAERWHRELPVHPGVLRQLGWEGLLVALVARNRPMVAIPVALVFAMLRTGWGFLAATGVERGIADVVRGMLVLALLIPPAVPSVRAGRRPAACRSSDRIDRGSSPT